MPTLGICLGAQLLAVATGGSGRSEARRARVRRPADRQAGQRRHRSAVRPDADHAGRHPVARRRDHRPAARRGPAGQLAGRATNQAFRLGRLAWGIQFHIETTPELLRRWADEDADRAGRLRRRGDPGPGGRRPTPTWSRSGGRSRERFAAIVARPDDGAGGPSDPDQHRRADHRPGRDPRRAGGRAAAASRQPPNLPGAAARPSTRTVADREPPPPMTGGCAMTGADRRGAHVLARVGFLDATRAEELLAGPALGWWDTDAERPVDSGAASRDRRAGAIRPTRTPRWPPWCDWSRRPAAIGADAELIDAIRTDARLARRLLNLLGVSTALADHLVANPLDWQVLLDDDDDALSTRLGPRGSRPASAPTSTTRSPGPAARRPLTGAAATAALRAAYLRELTAIAGRDLGGDLDIESVTARAGRPGRPDPAGRPGDRGGRPAAPTAAPVPAGDHRDGQDRRRANSTTSPTSTSIFVAEPGDEAVAGHRVRAGRAHDADLPGGRLGGRRRAAARRARRPAGAHAGQPRGVLQALGQHLGVPGAAEGAPGRRRPRARPALPGRSSRRWCGRRPSAPTSSPTSRRCAGAPSPTCRSTSPPRELKLGSGGLRDVEFAIQLLQLVHGRGDETLRVGGDLAGAGRAARRRLRRRRRRGQPGRCLPVPARRPNTGCSCAGCAAPTSCPQDADRAGACWPAAWAFGPTRAAAPTDVFEAEWALHAREVRRLHEKLFYRPLLEAVARVPSEALRLTPDEAGRRLAALGFADPAAALRHIEALTAGPVAAGGAAARAAARPAVLLRRRARTRRRAARLPAGVGRARRDAVVPAAAARRGRGGVAAGLRARDQPLRRRDAAARARRAADAGRRRPAGAPHRGELQAAMVEAVQRQPDADAGGARGARAAPPRVAADRVRRPARPPRRGRGLRGDQRDDRGDARRGAAGRDDRASPPSTGWPTLPVRIAVIAMGRLGGMETGYSSDADVMFVYEPADPDRAGTGRRSGWRSRSSCGCGRCWRRRRPIRRSASTPTCGPRGATARSCVRSLPMRSTTPGGRRPGRRRRCCGRGSRSATPNWAPGSSR